MMSNRSFIRFGGVAGILLAITSLTSVADYFALVPADQHQPVANATTYVASLAHDATGTLLFYGLYALIAFWAAVGIAALYYRVRAAGEAWAWFATLVGEIAAVGTLVAGLQSVASLRYVAGLARQQHSDAALLVFATPSPVNPLGIMTFGLTGVWFLTVVLLMLRGRWPILLVLLGFVAVADLAVGFIASVAGATLVMTYAALIAGAVGGPAFWLWVGILLYRDAGAADAQAARVA